MFCLFRKNRNLDLPIDCQIKLFDNTVLPILTYGCEIWGFGGIFCIEKAHTNFLKLILHVKKSTPHVMIYGELGRYPLSIVIKKRIISFWYKLVSGNANKLSSSLYRILLNDF